MKKFKWLIVIVDVILILLFYYFLLPPINISSPAFWEFIFLILAIILLSNILVNANDLIIYKRFEFRKYKLPMYILVAFAIIFLGIMIVNFISSPIFNAKEYSTRIEVKENHEFVNDVKLVDFSKIPLIDRTSSQKLGDRKMGEFTSWVSQFYVSDLYTQINYNNEIIRITPIEYDGFIKYLTNRDEGVKGYIKVNSVSGKATLENLKEGIKYLPSAYFFENLYRKLRISYPTTIFDKAAFEIDNEGNPYWIIPTVKYKAIGLKKEITGAVILNPIDGSSKKYKLKDIPSWVDHVFSADLIIEQIDNWGEYRGGFLNSIFGQKNVINTTDGYNYLVMDDDVYLYTGITSVSSDESNLGFVLVNLRTKETKYYLVPGAEEYSAMASAEGVVQDKKYEASFPLLINLNNQPTYLLSLKDKAGLVKMYAFIDVQDYQKVSVTDASLGIKKAAEKYLSEFDIIDDSKFLEKDITIESIKDVVIDNNSYYYILDTLGDVYGLSVKTNQKEVPFLKKGDNIKIVYMEGNIKEILEIEKGK